MKKEKEEGTTYQVVARILSVEKPWVRHVRAPFAQCEQVLIELVTVNVVEPVHALMHGAAPPAEICPALQEKHCVAPTWVEKWFVAQEEQAEAPTPETEPAGQSLQSDLEFVGENDPAEHFVQIPVADRPNPPLLKKKYTNPD